MKKLTIPTLFIGIILMLNLDSQEATTPEKKATGESHALNALKLESNFSLISSSVSGNVVALHLKKKFHIDQKKIVSDSIAHFLANPLNGRQRFGEQEYLRVRDYAAYCLAEADGLKFSVGVFSLPNERDIEIRQMVSSYYSK